MRNFLIVLNDIGYCCHILRRAFSKGDILQNHLLGFFKKIAQTHLSLCNSSKVIFHDSSQVWFCQRLMNAIYHGSTKRCRNKFLTLFLNTGKNIRLTRLCGEQICNDTVTCGWSTDTLTLLQFLLVWIIWTYETPDVGHGSQQRAFRETLWRGRLLRVNNIYRYRNYIAFGQHRNLLNYIVFVI